MAHCFPSLSASSILSQEKGDRRLLFHMDLPQMEVQPQTCIDTNRQTDVDKIQIHTYRKGRRKDKVRICISCSFFSPQTGLVVNELALGRDESMIQPQNVIRVLLLLQMLVSNLKRFLQLARPREKIFLFRIFLDNLNAALYLTELTVFLLSSLQDTSGLLITAQRNCVIVPDSNLRLSAIIVSIFLLL